MVFINRRAELDHLKRLCTAVVGGTAQRHLAFVGVRRIGKSLLLAHYIESNPPALCIPLQVDEASTSFPMFLMTMLRAAVGVAARRAGLPSLPAAAQATDILHTATQINTAVGELARRALQAVDARRPNGQDLFVHALSIPSEMSEALKQPVIVVADEFQAIADLATYAPFAGGRGRSRDAAEKALMQVVRAHIEQRKHVGWVVTGSGVHLLRSILARGALMGRFDEYPISNFNPADCATLAEAIWSELNVRWNDRAVDRVVQLTQGHPFYADVVCREAAVTALRLGQAVSTTIVDAAFIGAVHRPNGQINIACDEMHTSIAHSAPGLRGVLQVVARQGSSSLKEAADLLREHNTSTVYKHLQELVRLGFLRDAEDHTYSFEDPVFRYWVAIANEPLSLQQNLLDEAAVRRASTNYVEAFLRERNAAGPLREAYVRDLVRGFAGQQVEARRFGATGSHVVLPRVSTVKRITAFDEQGEVFGYPSEIELDLRFGDDTVWLTEVKDHVGRTDAGEINLCARKAAFMRKAHGLAAGLTWFFSTNGFSDDALAAAKVHAIYTSTLRDTESLRTAIATTVENGRRGARRGLSDATTEG